ncbi:hypothetical protein BV20DRAFT_1001606 [Pilatotrama ljubarskyi]|nr:hypothetical protein BV20DRAFT_1001606 [Pilatotrama ljubarskyi]
MQRTPNSDTLSLEFTATALAQQATPARHPSQGSSVDENARLNRALGHTVALARVALNYRQARDRDLAPEILLIIFKLVLEESSNKVVPDDTVWKSSFSDYRALITMTHVCARWRSILLTSATFWTVMSDHHPDGFLAFLRRSRRLPITVHLGVSVSNTDNSAMRTFLRLSNPHLSSRLRELHWHSQPRTTRKAYYLTFPAPALEVLSLTFDGDDEILDGEPAPYLFANQIPRLRTLSLGAIGWLPANDFSSLTHLCLSDLFYPTTFLEIVCFLQQCPQLEHLVLIGIEASFSEDPTVHQLPESNREVVLPHLRRLTFDNMPVEVVNDFLRFIALQRSDLALQVLRIPLDTDAGALSPVLVTSLAPTVSQPLTQFALMRSSWHSRVVIVATGPQTAVRLATVAPDVEVDRWYPDRPVEWAFLELDTFPLSQIEVFHLTFVAFPTRLYPMTPDLSNCIRRMDELKQLVIWTNDLAMLLSDMYSRRSIVPSAAELLPSTWRLPVLHIVAVPDNGAQPHPDDKFVIPDVSSVPAIDDVVIHCPLPGETFKNTLRTLGGICRSVEYRESRSCPRFSFPDVCHDPAADPSWAGASWDFPC